MSLFSSSNGKIIIADNTKPIECATCPCYPGGPSCPEDCSGCCSMKAIITGASGDCESCAQMNSSQILDRTGCTWYADWVGATASYDLSIECVGGKWEMTLTIYSAYGSGCDFNDDSYFGSIDVTESGCPIGTFTLDHVSGNNCEGTVSVQIACIVPCPTNCDGCETDYSIAISGIAGTCTACADANTTKTITAQSACYWYTDWYDDNGGYTVNLYCDGSDWILQVWIVSAWGSGCTGSDDLYEGKIPNVNGCPTGTYTLYHTSPYNTQCSSATATAVIS